VRFVAYGAKSESETAVTSGVWESMLAARMVTIDESEIGDWQRVDMIVSEREIVTAGRERS